MGGSGEALPAGAVGEKLEATGIVTVPTFGTFHYVTGARITLTPGTWLIAFYGDSYYYNTTNNAALINQTQKIRNTTDNIDIIFQTNRGLFSVVHSDFSSTFGGSKIVTVTSNKVIEIQQRFNTEIGTYTAGTNLANAVITAVRIA